MVELLQGPLFLFRFLSLPVFFAHSSMQLRRATVSNLVLVTDYCYPYHL
jgi:hypothetical protein